ncbi:hypothetical protein LIER_04717 [Lithospermum erythrorhizon]|uniref:Reverse transcriptase zinc-binding domain-containing protein n=1 Tax=Lithospermum erythrorhizon TaxID=34254 RepID=A0AAV3NZC9_LITER
MFADDMFVMFATNVKSITAANVKSITTIKGVLNMFGKIAGLSHNLEKSYFYVAGTPDEVFLAGECNGLIEKVTNRVKGWQLKKLSYVGRFQLITSVIQGVHVFWDSTMPILKKAGGLGLKDLYVWNRAFMILNLWKVCQKKDNLFKVEVNSFRRRFVELAKRTEVEDRMEWKHVGKMDIRTKDVYEAIMKKGESKLWNKLIWHKYCIPRQSVVVWFLLRGRLETKDRVAEWWLRGRVELVYD